MNVGTLTAFLKLDTSDFDSSAKDAEKSGGGLGRTLSGGLGKGAKVAAGAVAAAGAAAAAGAFKTASYGDELDKTSTRLGVNTDFLQDATYWASQNGIESATLERATGRLNQRIGEAADGTGKYADAFSDLGVSIHDSGGDLRDTEDVMRDTIDALVAIEDPAERSAAAADVFGTRVARDLMPALEDGSLTLEEATAAMDGHGRMTEEQIESAVAFSDAWDDVKTAGMSLLRDAFAPVMEFMSDRLFPFINDTVVPALQAFSEWIGPKLAAAAEQVGEWWDEYVEPVFEALAAWWDENGEAIIAKAKELWEGVKEAFTEFGEFVGETVERIRNFFRGFVSNNEETTGRVGEIWDSLKETAETIFEAIRDVIEVAIDAARRVLERVTRTMRRNWDRWGDTILKAADKIWNAILDVIDGVLKVIRGVFDVFAGLFTGDWDRMWSGVKDIFGGILDTIQGVWDGLLGALEAAWEIFRDLLSDAWDNFWGWVLDKASEWWGKVGDAWDELLEFFSDAWDAAKDLIQDAWAEAWGWVADKAAEIWEGITDTIGGWIDNIVEGVEKGVEAAKEAWDGLRSALAVPVNFAINSVYNDGIRRLWNAVADKVPGISGLRRMSPVALNRGGFVPGGGPDRDSVPAMLTPGEFVLNRRAAQRIPDDVLRKLNDPSWSLSRRGMGGTGGDLGDVLGYNAGGFAKTPDEVLDEARRQSGPYQWGGFGPRFDCSGFMAWLSNYAATGNGRSGGRWATGMATGRNKVGRFEPGEGDPETGFSIGIRPSGYGGRSIGHTAGTVAGVNVESAGGIGSHVGGHRGYRYGPYRYHLPDFGGPSAEMLGWWSTIGDAISGLGEAFDNPAANMFRETILSAVSGAAEWLLDRVPFGGVLRDIAGLAEGGTTSSAGSLRVGEDGPELVTLPKRATVSPENDVVDLLRSIDRRLAKGGGGPLVSAENINIEDGMDVEEFGRRLAAAARL